MRLIGITRLLRLRQKNGIQSAHGHSGKFSEITTTLYHQMVDGARFEGSLYASPTEHKSTLRIAFTRILRPQGAQRDQEQARSKQRPGAPITGGSDSDS